MKNDIANGDRTCDRNFNDRYDHVGQVLIQCTALLACCLLVVTGISTIEDAFAGFVDKNVIMVAGFMAVMAGVQKTSLMGNIKHIMAKLATKGGFLAYAMIIIVVMLGTSLVGGGNTGYYVMILTILASIPYSKHLPNSKLLLPGGFATGRALIPVSVAFFMGLSSSLLEGTGVEGEVTLPATQAWCFS